MVLWGWVYTVGVPVNEMFVTAAAVILAGTSLTGLIVRRRVGVCWSFAVYLAVVAAADLLMLLWPARFWQLPFYVGKEFLIDVLRFVLALELTWRTFRAFPSARATARGVLLVVLLATLALVFAGTGDLEPVEGAPALGPLISRVQPRVMNGAIWLLTGIAGLILWYRLPVHPLHKAILVGYVPYLLVFTVSLNVLESHGWHIREQVNYVHTSAFLVVLGYWVVAAWRRAETPVHPRGVESRLEEVVG